MNIISDKHDKPQELTKIYTSNNPYPHIVLNDFINHDLLKKVADEFPDLDQLPNTVRFKERTSIKLASQGTENLSPAARDLINYLNSDLFLKYLQKLTGINETLISDPYLFGGGYHEIKKGGYLKVHADYNKHDYFELDRRVNLLLYLNDDWKEEWGGNLELYSKDNLTSPAISVPPIFNRCVIFNTTSFAYHGHPDPLDCPENRSRRSIALYYFTLGRPANEIKDKHNTLYVGVKDEKFKFTFKQKLVDIIKDICPPILLRLVKKVVS